ncbi:MAG: 4a-hydroxytetrahydrobiopterin dehydratase [Actinobacteria bacterium]|nr:4a-hydroxytetrahydrobiopterin dehydratase [Actinomycetota bacterium]NDG77552.1 4a-hydroxytetrahydrobiopterin dehydratase [Acidimicrobiia bacterium]NBO80318.1 4a-hydroxytetrahydrobiopterin dehydratase [Actinomycetota bacterium]NBP18356.1 4a-hydroxytetrahydrobiopterin dehydratase [Actinomycetota bacterium]NBR92559.1 4a-hydroxytetrahydrobiopterin dehydratase [Actinomycetota bacterium]
MSNTPEGWQQRDNALHREFDFADFSAAFAFMTRVAMLAERHGHHPDWSNSWNRVRISLCSHDAGGVVTQRDIDLAHDISALLDAAS